LLCITSWFYIKCSEKNGTANEQIADLSYVNNFSSSSPPTGGAGTDSEESGGADAIGRKV
jgi:hypothetical protein